MSKSFLAMATLACLVAVTIASPIQDAQNFTVALGYNACGSECGCSTPDCSDIKYPYKYIGTFSTDQPCEDSCATNASCNIWIHSQNSGHCFWRLDSTWDIIVARGVNSGCRTGAPFCTAAPTPAPPAPTPPPSPFKPTDADNMNGEYILSLTPNGQGAKEKFPTNYKDYPYGVEYFDVYSPPITSLYSQVFWTGLPAVDLPADIVQRYAGRGMAVVGFEIDQVRQTPEGDVSVPINVAYNHHFEAALSGANSRFKKIYFDGPNDPRIAEIEKKNGHGIPSHEHHTIIEDLNPGGAIPSSQAFGGGNGGEYRKTFHGFAPGFAQIIHSPEKFMLTPMQIDTWNRDKMNLTGGKFVPGPEPANSAAPPPGSDSLYSGLLECPVTTRIRKQIDGAYKVQNHGSCASNVIAGASECFAAAPQSVGGAGNTYVNVELSDATMPAGCSVTTDATDPMKINVFFNKATSSSVTCGADNAQTLSGGTPSYANVSVQLDVASALATITLVGNSSAWFGVGFNASAMKDAPWAIICEGTGKVTERQLQDQNPGSLLTPSVTVKSNTVVNGVRTVIVTRPFAGKIFSFNPNNAADIPFINAVGSSPELSYHKFKIPSTLSLLPIGNTSGVCICEQDPAPFGQGKGKLVYVPVDQPGEKGQGTIGFGNSCPPAPRTDLLWQKNPTCDVRTYSGGQTACHHMFSLLDADQEIPWVDQPLVYSQKWRFWVQPYNETYHTNVAQQHWGIGSLVEYDVPKCDATIPNCTKQADGNWVHTIRGTYKYSGKLAAAHFHCHAPTCLSMKMYRCPLGATDCDETTGELLCEERPVYGGTGKIDLPAFDEPGFILQPPCMWGDSEFGLEAPVDVTGYYLHTVKTANATWGHHGEMAWQQMFTF
eukprot:m.241412 g.241412  ORF g.241412 m.241412 type:complete len:883 (+) comp33774_c0_seq2:100-2748(+)